jgi:hypothetical protein
LPLTDVDLAHEATARPRPTSFDAAAMVSMLLAAQASVTIPGHGECDGSDRRDGRAARWGEGFSPGRVSTEDEELSRHDA